MKRTLVFLLIVIGFSPILAQDTTCPSVVQAIIDLVKTHCAYIGRNRACYGNTTLQAEPQAGITAFAFDQPGDFINVAGLRTLRAVPLNTTTSEWGVAMMKVQANIPDTLPGQGVTFLLFGNVELENTVPITSAGVEVTTTADSVLRGLPSADSSLVGAITSGQPAVAINRSTDDAWVRVELQGPGSRAGWIPVALLGGTSLGNLPAYDPADSAPGPMQAFRLKSTPLGNQCLDAPPDGILVQTPQGDIRVELTINDVHIQLGSTVFIQAQPDDVMTLSVLEGHAQVTALGQIADVPQGMRVSIPMDGDLRPAAPPGTVRPYDAGSLEHLPITLLPDAIMIAQVDWASGKSLCVTKADGAWLRGAPNSGSADVVRVLANDDSVAVSGAPQFDGVQTWWPVRTGDNRSGWIEQASLAACDRPVVPPCTPRTDWLARYTVAAGDTLSKIAAAVSSSTAELSQANCIANPSTLLAGQVIRVPRDVITPAADVLPGTAATPDVVPDMMVDGQWDFTIYQHICDSTSVQSQTLNVTISPDKSAITLSATGGNPLTLGRIGEGVYQTTIASGPVDRSPAQVQLQAQVPARTAMVTATVIRFISGRTQARLDITAACDKTTSD